MNIDDENSSKSIWSSISDPSTFSQSSISISFTSTSSSSDILQVNVSDDNDSSIFSTSSDESNDTMERFVASYFYADSEVLGNNTNGYDSDIDAPGQAAAQRWERQPNQFGYSFGNFMECNYYKQFLCPEVREQTYLQSKNP